MSAWIRRSTRLAIYTRDGFRCTYCGRPVATARKPHLAPLLATLDHVTPREHGGSNEPANLVTACKPCNERKASALLVSWLHKLDNAARMRLHVQPTFAIPRAIGRALSNGGF